MTRPSFLPTAALFTLLLALTLATARAADDNGAARWWSHVRALANDGMRGRDTGSDGHRRAADYLAAQFTQAGLEPAGTDGFLQPVAFQAKKIDESRSSLALIRNGQAEPLALGDDALINLRIDPAASVEAPLVFAGYGLTVPERGYDDLEGLDVKGKIIVTFGGGPSTIPGPLRSHYSYPTERGKVLARAGAVGLVTIANPRTADLPWERSALARLDESMSLADRTLVDMTDMQIGITVNAAHADKWLAGSGHTVKELLDLIDAGKPLPRFPLVPRLRARVAVERRPVMSQNVVAVRRGSDAALRNEYVVLSAHLDHVGEGQPIDGDRIYNGAMDNASGIAAMIDIAQRLQEANVRTRRSVLFVAVTGEEKGLLGSRYFAAHPTVDAKAMVADLNVDMFLPLYPFRIATVYGVNESDLGDTIKALGRRSGVTVEDDPAPNRNIFVRSDQYNFIRRGVPAVMIDIGFAKGSKDEATNKAWLSKRYHAPSDDLDQPIDMKAAADFVRFVQQVAVDVANAPARPQWKPASFFRRFQ